MAARFRKAKITDGVIRALEPGETVMDVEEIGFGVRRQGHDAVFFVRKHARGQRHFQTIGAYGTGGLTVASARDKAKRLVVALRDGLSPAERRARDRTMPTVAELSAEWLCVHVDAKLKNSTARLYRSTLRSVILPALGRVRVDQVSDEHVARMHFAARDRPYVANRGAAILSKMMSFAERTGLRPKGTNPVRGLERYREEQRERFLSSEELGRLGAALADPAIAARHSPFAIAAVMLLLLTGARLREILHLKWHEVDLPRGLLLLADSKTGKKPVILGEPARRLLEQLARTSSEYVFPGHKPGRPMADIKKTWASLVTAANLDGVRVHDLRHTYAAYTAGAGGSLPMIGRLLGQSQAATTQRYAHLAAGPLHDLADRATAVISDALAPPRKEG